MFELDSAEEIIKKTKPHAASFLSSPLFWIGVLFLFLGLIEVFLMSSPFVGVILSCASVLLIAVSYLRRVASYTFVFTDIRVVSSYSFIRKAYREIYYDRVISAKMMQGILGRISGYGDVWFYGYQNGWIVGRMRGVSLGDWEIVANKAWKSARNL
jgi:hypothetical protein